MRGETRAKQAGQSIALAIPRRNGVRNSANNSIGPFASSSAPISARTPSSMCSDFAEQHQVGAKSQAGRLNRLVQQAGQPHQSGEFAISKPPQSLLHDVSQ